MKVVVRGIHSLAPSGWEAQFSQMAESQPELLTHHFTEAGMGENAVRYMLRAGQQARELSAMMEAAALVGKALRLVPTLPESIERQ